MENKKSTLPLAAFIIGLVTYNAALFVIAGFSHGAAFYTSYVFMLLAFASIIFAAVMMKKRGMGMKDILLGYPLIKHCTIYFIAELIVSVIFMLLDAKVGFAAPFAVQLIMLCVHLMFALSCLIARDKIEEMRTQVNDSTLFISMLKVDADALVLRAKEREVKEAYKKLSEEIRFSDPVSSSPLFPTEREISAKMVAARECIATDADKALALCAEMSALLKIRNEMCKMVK